MRLTPLSFFGSISQCDKEIEQVQSQLDDYKDPPLSLSRLSLKQQKFKTFRETANVSGQNDIFFTVFVKTFIKHIIICIFVCMWWYTQK